MLVILAAEVAYAGCGALKPDSFGNRKWENEAFRIAVEDGVPSVSFMLRRAGVEDTPVVDATLSIALKDGTVVERPLSKPAPAAASLWANSLPVTTWWVPVALDDELMGALQRSQVEAIRIVTPLRTDTMEYPAMAVEVVAASNAGKVPSLRAKPLPKMLGCLES